MKYKLEKLSSEYLPLILEWRNSDRIRKNMNNEEIVSLNDHIQWFNKISQSKEDLNFIYLVDQVPIGFIYFNNINYLHSHCEWGFYIGNPNVFNGAGTIMGIMGLNYIFHHLKLNKVYGDVLDYNKASIKFHEKFGFVKEGYFQQHINKNGEFVNVIKYGILKKYWFSNQVNLVKNLYEKGIDLNGEYNISCKS